MQKTKALFCLLGVMMGFAAGHAGAADAPLSGRWLTEKGKVAVTFYSCPSGTCGRIDWLAKPNYKDGSLKRDSKNPVPGLRNRPWCGITVIEGLRPDGEGGWADGKFYNPKDGKKYDVAITDQGETLKVRAYLGIKLLGKTENWQPAGKDIPQCPAQD